VLGALLATTGYGAAQPPLKILCLGDSHATVEAGMGQALANAFQAPVRYAPVGINGARTEHLTQSFTRQGPFAFDLRWAEAWHPDVVLIALGTNDGTAPRLSAAYQASFERLLARAREAFPPAQIVVLGPPPADPHRVPCLLEVRLAQAQAASHNRAGWVDRAVLLQGGLRADGVHFTPAAYRSLALGVADILPGLLLPRDPGPGHDALQAPNRVARRRE
jgi:lysophospholipase L1-like esterase